MADTTNISWADMTFNPWIGCTRIAPACDGCYAAHLMETRMHRAEWGGPGKGNGTRVRTNAANWRKPLAWNAKAAKEGTRPFVFCASLADAFDNAVPDEWRRDLFDLIRATPHLVWLLLTKRPQNIAKMAERAGGLPENAAIGTTVEDQPRANINVQALLQASVDLWHAKTRPLFLFLSCEPWMAYVEGHHDLFALAPAAEKEICEAFPCHGSMITEYLDSAGGVTLAHFWLKQADEAGVDGQPVYETANADEDGAFAVTGVRFE